METNGVLEEKLWSQNHLISKFESVAGRGASEEHERNGRNGGGRRVMQIFNT